MDELKRLKAKLAELASKMQGLSDSVARDNGGVFSDEQREQFDGWDTEYEATLGKVNEIEADADRKRKANERLGKASRDAGRTTDPDPIEQNEKPEPEAPSFESLGQQMLAIHQAALTAVDGRVLPRDIAERLAPSGSSSGVDSDGGYLVQKDFSSELFKRMYEVGEVMSRVRRIPIGPNADGLRMNAFDETSRANGSRFGGIRAYWSAEAAQMTGTKPKFRQIELELQDLTGLWYATNRMLQDAVALEAVAMEAFPEELSFVAEDAIFNGDGAGKPLGILHDSNPSLVTVSKETGQEANSVQIKNLNKMWTRMWARSRRNAAWYINQDVEEKLFGLEFPVGTGGVPAFLPPGGLSSSPYSTLFGRPIIPVEYCPTLGDKGDIVLADMTQYLTINKGGVQSASSIHLRFDYNETAFRWVMRLNGQPLWNAPLTPFKGSSTLSPFVTLAARA